MSLRVFDVPDHLPITIISDDSGLTIFNWNSPTAFNISIFNNKTPLFRFGSYHGTPGGVYYDKHGNLLHSIYYPIPAKFDEFLRALSRDGFGEVVSWILFHTDEFLGKNK